MTWDSYHIAYCVAGYDSDYSRAVLAQAMAGGSYPHPPAATPYYRNLPYRKYFVDSPIGVESRSMVVRTSGKAVVLPLYSRAYYPKTASAERYFITPVAPKAVAAVRVYASPLPYKQKRLRKVMVFYFFVSDVIL